MYHCSTCKKGITASENYWNAGTCQGCYFAHIPAMPDIKPTGCAPVAVKWSAEHGIQATSPNFENTVESF